MIQPPTLACRGLFIILVTFMKANTEIFKNNEAEYREWLEDNLSGYVINPKKNPKTGDFKLHRSGCSHIHDKTVTTYTLNGNRKICSNNPNEAIALLKKEKTFNGIIMPCSTCKPVY